MFQAKFVRIGGFGALLTFPAQVFAAGSGPLVEMVNWYGVLLHSFGIHDHHTAHEWQVVPAGLISLAILTFIGMIFRSSLLRAGGDPVPENSFSVRTFVEMVMDFIFNLGQDVIGKENAPRFFSLLSTLFLFIFVSNLTGLVPGFPPATESLNTNLAMGLVVFLTYNYAGLKEHGGSYVRHFLGPIWWLAPLFLLIETVSHIARPLSLSLRLYGNIFGDHLVLSVFTGLSYLIFPAFLLFFGLLVASIQSFVFTLLSSIYISMAVSHDH